MDLGFFKKSIPTLLFLIVFSIIGVTVFYQLMSQDERLKIYNPIDINPRLVDISKFISQIFSLLVVKQYVYPWPTI